MKFINHLAQVFGHGVKAVDDVTDDILALHLAAEAQVLVADGGGDFCNLLKLFDQHDFHHLKCGDAHNDAGNQAADGEAQVHAFLPGDKEISKEWKTDAKHHTKTQKGQKHVTQDAFCH